MTIFERRFDRLVFRFWGLLLGGFLLSRIGGCITITGPERVDINLIKFEQERAEKPADPPRR